MADLETLWGIHREAQWPKAIGPLEGELMTLDTVIGGCLSYYMEERSLDRPRVEMLEGCLGDLETLLPEIVQEGTEYFERLSRLAKLLLQECRA